MMSKVVLCVSLLVVCATAKYQSEIVKLPGHKVRNSFTSPLPHEYTLESDLPVAWDWSDVNGTSFVSRNLNQHIPQYCGSCWAHGALSAFADRIKIARGAKGVDINFAIQYILNCGTEVAGSCHGGYHTAVYEFITQTGFVPFDSCLQYEACSSESDEGSCKYGDYSCNAMNTCRTCSTFDSAGGFCSGIDIFPNASVAEYGEVPNSVSALKAEIYKRGPVACGVNAEPVLKYTGGIFSDTTADQGVNHIVSIIGWGVDSDTNQEYWIIRNSWGEYWGEMGYFRIETGSNILGIESECAWATPDSWTEMNVGCYEDGSNCVKNVRYVDPSVLLPSRSTSAPSALTPSV